MGRESQFHFSSKSRHREEITELGISAGSALHYTGRHMNAWNVIWWQEGKKYLKKFEGEKPSESGAIAFAKRLQEKGITPNLISRRKAFAPPREKRRAPEVGMLWCPYCLKWRHFTERAIRRRGLLIPTAWRCPICTISIQNAFVRMYNVEMVIKLENRKRDKVPSEKKIRRTLQNGRK